MFSCSDWCESCWFGDVQWRIRHAMCYSGITASFCAAGLVGESVMSKHSKHTWVIDVIEDGSASIEVDGRSVTPIPAWMLPEGAKEGDVLSVTHDRREGKSALLIETDPDAKKKALDRSANQVSRKSKNNRGGDIQL
jgi:hypothetical protein